MNKKQIVAIIAIIVAGMLFGSYVLLTGRNPAEQAGGKPAEAGQQDAKQQGESGGRASAPAKGPHGGQQYKNGDLGLELVLAEERGASYFRAFLSNQGKSLPPSAATVTATVNRPNGTKEEIAFAPEKDALVSTAAIAEPHVFDAIIMAKTPQGTSTFSFSKDEGKIAMSDAQVKASGVAIATSGAAAIENALQLPGEIGFNEDRTAHVVPRVTGVVEAVPVNLGQVVKKNTVLAVLASTSLSEQRSDLLAAQKRFDFARSAYEREKKLWEEKISALQDYQQAQEQLREAEIALQNARQKLNALGASSIGSGPLNRFEVRAPFDGMIVEKHITLGETVKEDANIFVLSDLSTVWAEIVVPAKDIDKVRVGAEAVVKATSSESKATGKVSFVGALIGEQTRTAKARVVLANPQMAWRPGLYVTVELIAGEAQVPVTVTADAVQSLNEKSVVYLRIPGGFVAQPVTVGRSDGKQVEITSGLKPGVPYAAAGSFVIKAEQGKSSSAHED